MGFGVGWMIEEVGQTPKAPGQRTFAYPAIEHNNVAVGSEEVVQDGRRLSVPQSDGTLLQRDPWPSSR